MIKTWIAALVVGLVLAAPAFAQSDVDPNRYGAIVVEANTGKILYADHPDRVLHPASLTKLMTLYMTFSALRSGKLDETTELPVSRYATAASPTKLNLRAGDTIPVKDAVLGLITRSANDAARVLAEGIGGNETHFAEMMTDQARRLGMTHTVFRNASGLPNPEQASSPKDMAMLARAIITQFPEYYELFSTRSFTYRGVVYTNHNHLMERYPGMDGMKTGYVAASGFNLVSSAVQGGTRLIGVVFGGRSAAMRDNYMAGLLDRSFMEAGNANAPGEGRRFAREINTQGTLPDMEDEPDLASGGQDVAANQQDYPDAAQAPTPNAKLQHVLATATAAGAGAGAGDDDAPQLIQASATPAEAMDAKDLKLSKGKKGDWGVQLGAFRSKRDAKLALLRAQHKYRSLHSASSVIATARTKGGVPVYQARLVGLTQNAASQACTALEAHGRGCTPLKPTG